MTETQIPPATGKFARSQMANRRRRELYAARADDRRAARQAVETRELLRRYADLKGSMKRAGLRIGPINDIAKKLDDPEERFSVLRRRVERWDALWSIMLRKRETRGKIIIGGAVLAELADLVMQDQADQAFLARVMRLLDSRVERVRDRLVLNALLAGDGQARLTLPLRPGGPPNESLEDALAAIGESLAAFERGPAGGGLYDHDEGDEADLHELIEGESLDR